MTSLKWISLISTLIISIAMPMVPLQAQTPPPGSNLCDPVFTCDQPHAQAPGVWGALAYSRSTFRYGTSWGYQDEQDARNFSLHNCIVASGDQRDCKVLSSFANACVALAVSSPEGAWGLSAPYGNLTVAARNALAECRKAGGAKCQVALEAKNSCMAVSMSDDFKWGGASSNNKRDVEVRALQNCRNTHGKNCDVVKSACPNDPHP
jgi:Domain of unknown function (DUF4189)